MSTQHEDTDIKEDVYHNEGTHVPVVKLTDVNGVDGAQVRNVYSAELYAAVQESHIPPFATRTLKLYFAIFVTFCCSCANGYDGSVFTGILSMDHFQDTFKSGKTGPKVSIMSSMYSVGSLVGSPFAAFVADRWGRRAGMFCGACFIITGMIITASASTIAQFAVGRFVLGFGIHFMTISAPSYTMEISPPHWRGRCTGLYNCGYYGGAIPAAAITYGCNHLKNNWSWRLPLIFQAFACTLVICFVFLIPESPRWLMAKGREEEAFDFLVQYHANGDRDSKLVALEIEEFREHIAQDGADKRWWDYRSLVLTRNGRWRMAQVMMMSISGQFSGNGLSYYNTVIYQELGVKTVTKQLAYNLLYNVVAATGAVGGASLTDRMPRRKVLVIGTALCSCMLAINAGLQLDIGNHAKAVSRSVFQGALASYFLFGFIFEFAYAPLQAVVPAEALETTIRAKGLALAGVVSGCIGFINTFAGPIGLHNIGYRYVWIFVAWDAFEAVMWYLFGVESQGKTLEELNWIYDQPNPVRASKRVSKVVVKEDGTVAGEVQA